MSHKRTVLKHTMLLERDPEIVFPLLCPVREYEWISTWKADLIYSRSGLAELDCIFQTSFPTDGPKDTWVVCRYEKPTLVEFVRVNAIRAIRYTITLRQFGEGKTEAEWRQIVTGLDDEGDRLVEGLSNDAFKKRMEALKGMLNHFMSTGKMLVSAE
jgi:hypothetical protein